MYSCLDLPFPLLLLTAFLAFLLTALIMGVRRDIRANKQSSTPERIGAGVAIPLTVGIAYIVIVEVAAFRFWDYLAIPIVP